MTTTDDLIRAVRQADPLDADAADRWLGSPAAREALAAVFSAPAPPDRPRRTWQVAAVVAAVGAGSTATAFATGVLGGPAPDRVKEHLAELDRGMPADLRYDADLEHARAVAATVSGVLYLADTRDGGYCIEVVSDTDRPRGATCITGAQVGVRPIEVTAPIPDSADSPLLVGGRADAADIAAMRVRYADGTVTDLPFGTDRAWLLEVPAEQQASALAQGLVVIAVDADGAQLASVKVPPLRDDDPLGTRHDAEQPIVSSTISDGDDFRLVLGVEGDVNVSGDVRLTLRCPDGTTVRVPLAADGTFTLMLPDRRTDDFAEQPGQLVVTRDGEVVATTPVASVAYWRTLSG